MGILHSCPLPMELTKAYLDISLTIPMYIDLLLKVVWENVPKVYIKFSIGFSDGERIFKV